MATENAAPAITTQWNSATPPEQLVWVTKAREPFAQTLRRADKPLRFPYGDNNTVNVGSWDAATKCMQPYQLSKANGDEWMPARQAILRVGRAPAFERVRRAAEAYAQGERAMIITEGVTDKQDYYSSYELAEHRAALYFKQLPDGCFEGCEVIHIADYMDSELNPRFSELLEDLEDLNMLEAYSLSRMQQALAACIAWQR